MRLDYLEIKKELCSGVSAHFVVSDATGFRERGAFLPGEQALRTTTQVHGAEGAIVTSDFNIPEGDWLATYEKNLALGVFVADCTAILITGLSAKGRFVAALHAGWRGTAKGIIQRALEKINPDPSSCVAWLSPSISQNHFEVGQEVVEALSAESKYLKPSKPGYYFYDLKAYQKDELKRLGLSFIDYPLCTYEQPEFFSYREKQGSLDARHLAWVCWS